MNELALFAGGGGGILGGKLLGWKTVCAVEWEPYCQAILLARQADGHLDQFPIWGDIRTFNGAPLRGFVDVVSAGFPCQPFSTAGKRKGEADERNMWPDTIRVIREVGPEWCLLENVPGLVTSGYFGTILRDLAKAGYDAEWDVFSAAGEGAPHLRERLWIVAHARGQQSEGGERPIGWKASGKFSSKLSNTRSKKPDGVSNFGREKISALGGSGEMAHAQQRGRRQTHADDQAKGRKSNFGSGGICNPAKQGFQNRGTETLGEPRSEQEFKRPDWWAVEPPLGRVAHGVAHRVDRLKTLGNGQVPSVAARAWMELSGRFLNG